MLKQLSVVLFSTALFAVAPRALSVNISETFTTDPVENGWHIFGVTNSFSWDSSAQNLEVTWDSRNSNSFFYVPLGQLVTRHDDFTFAFDLKLRDIASGIEPGKTGPLQLGFGFLNLTNVTTTNFMRGSYGSAPNVAEFNYYTSGYYDFGGTIFPASAATAPSFISANNSFAYAPINVAVYNSEIPTNQTAHISFSFVASNQTVTVTVTTNGVSLATLPPLQLKSANGFEESDDFRADIFSVSSYSSAGDDYDSVLAHGTIDNITVSIPSPAQRLSGAFSGGFWQVQFENHLNWNYSLQRSTNLVAWTDVSSSANGNGTNLFLIETNSISGPAFYRIRAFRP